MRRADRRSAHGKAAISSPPTRAPSPATNVDRPIRLETRAAAFDQDVGLVVAPVEPVVVERRAKRSLRGDKTVARACRVSARTAPQAEQNTHSPSNTSAACRRGNRNGRILAIAVIRPHRLILSPAIRYDPVKRRRAIGLDLAALDQVLDMREHGKSGGRRRGSVSR